jgi:hypothetical protein
VSVGRMPPVLVHGHQHACLVPKSKGPVRRRPSVKSALFDCPVTCVGGVLTSSAKGSKLDEGSHASLVPLRSAFGSANTPTPPWVFVSLSIKLWVMISPPGLCTARVGHTTCC